MDSPLRMGMYGPPAHMTTLMLLLIFRVLRHMLSKSESGKTSTHEHSCYVATL